MSTIGCDSVGCRVGLVAAFAFAGALLSGPPAKAERGVALDVGRISITDRLLPGGGYRLPTLGVRNPGDERATYRMVVSATGGEGRQPPPAWFRFRPATFSLEPGATRAVTARIDLPAGADSGEYEALVGAELVSTAGGARVGAGAAAHVSFTVEPSSPLAAYLLQLKAFLARGAPWSWLVPPGLVLLAAAAVVRRRFSFTVARRA